MYFQPIEMRALPPHVWSLSASQMHNASTERNALPEPTRWLYAPPTLDSANAMPTQARTYISSAALKAWAFKQDFWLSRDKAQHFAACFFIAFSSRIAATSILGMEKSAANAFAGGLATFAGFMREVTDDHEYNNIFSTKDMVANMLGVFLAMVVLAFI